MSANPIQAARTATAPTLLLSVGRSRTNQRIFWVFVALVVLALMVDLRLSGRPEFPTWAFLILCSWQALRTFVVLTLFTSESIQYRSAMGVWHDMPYSSVLLERRARKAVILHGPDRQGHKMRIVIVRRDGDLDKIAGVVTHQRY